MASTSWCPVRPGMVMSVTSRAGRSCSTSSNPRSPSSAVKSSCPLPCNVAMIAFMMVGSSSQTTILAIGLPRPLRAGHGQRDVKRGALALLTLSPGSPAVQLDNLSHDGEPKSDAFDSRAVLLGESSVAPENDLELILRNAHALIADPEVSECRLRPRSDRDVAS